jgi:S1-C subfamily serine protease
VVHTQDPNIGEAIADKVLPSVVGIETSYEVSIGGGYSYFFGGGGGKTLTTAQGTGFVVDEAGYILTNSHVVNDGNYRTVTVLLYDGREFSGTVLWNDPTLDMAIVKIEATGLVAAELGDSDTVKVGSYAAAIGNPLGLQFKFSMSQGIISGLERTIEVSSGSSSMSATTMEGLLQTDATINSGNSGGPLVNKYGQVVGINSAKASSGEGMGFAIPINSAKPIVRQIKQTGSFSRAYLGISGQGLEESTGYNAEAFKERYGTARGIYVYSVAANGGAEAAGLQKGDIVLSVDGTEVGTMNRINTVLVGYKPGDKVTVKYLRNGEESTVTVTLTGSIG